MPHYKLIKIYRLVVKIKKAKKNIETTLNKFKTILWKIVYKHYKKPMKIKNQKKN